MREILFRGKRKNDCAWIKGYCLGPTREIDEFGIQEVNDWYYEIEAKTLGQYTNLDDRNGQKVFEGDILRIYKKGDALGTYYFPPVEYPANVVVKWDLCAWQWEVIGKEKYYIHFPEAWCHYECEVIGNIYDNPELLEVE